MLAHTALAFLALPFLALGQSSSVSRVSSSAAPAASGRSTIHRVIVGELQTGHQEKGGRSGTHKSLFFEF